MNEHPFFHFLKRLGRNKTAMFGGILLLAFVFMAFLAPYLVSHLPGDIKPSVRLRPPGGEYWFGTDRMGRDIFSRVVYGARVSLVVGLSVVALTTLFGAVIGLLAGYYRKIDEVCMRILDGLMAFPGIILMICIMAVLGQSMWNVVLALTIVYTPRMARVVRSAVLVQKELTYVMAARSVGASNFRILAMHISRNCVAPIIIQATMIFAYVVLAESSLSFLGVGMPPEIPSWGNILSEGKVFLRRAPWISIFPGVAIAMCVLALNTLGDGLRDVLDPKLRRGATGDS